MRGRGIMAAWTVIEHTGDWMALSRSGEILELECPNTVTAKIVFKELRVGQVVDEGMLRLLMGKQ